MKGKIILKLLKEENQKLYVKVETMYRKYEGYLFNHEGNLNLGRNRADFFKKIINDKSLVKQICIDSKDVIDLSYNHNNRKLELHLAKTYEGTYCGFRAAE